MNEAPRHTSAGGRHEAVGLASVELLAREGAHVRATDLKPLDQLPEAREL